MPEDKKEFNPCINLNGSDPEVLFSGYMEAGHKIDNAIKAFHACMPTAKDYPNSIDQDGAVNFKYAVMQHLEIIHCMKLAFNFCIAKLDAIQAQIDARAIDARAKK